MTEVLPPSVNSCASFHHPNLSQETTGHAEGSAFALSKRDSNDDMIRNTVVYSLMWAPAHYITYRLTTTAQVR